MPTTAQPGDVVLVRFPSTDLTTTKLRPAVVLATHGDDLTILGIFSGPPQPSQPTWIVLSSQDRTFSKTGLQTTSVIKAERIAVIEKSVIVRKLGSLSTSQSVAFAADMRAACFGRRREAAAPAASKNPKHQK